MSTYLPTVFGENLMDVFDDFDRNFFRGWGNVDRELYGKHARHMMKTDVKEVENGYEVDIDLPGFKKDEITLELKDGYLTISAQKAIEKDNEKHGRTPAAGALRGHDAAQLLCGRAHHGGRREGFLRERRAALGDPEEGRAEDARKESHPD